ncbi:hypothetical protein SAY86_013211 [Trapa natans]|uniref:Growth-regulating factor n=1 Tax=Trapa natans TaxID=22666 RepID=A0AAN7MBD3_TRANT|nr:hypothetical protein SAY86_013211 [Trapa natans]
MGCVCAGCDAAIRFRQEALDYMNSMIPDMERCRRTDGKKWRCNKNVVPHHKYCERHVNRGQQRCRRPLEISRIASPSQRRTMSRMNDDIRQAKVDISLGLGLNTDISSDVNSRNKSSLGDKDGYGASAAIAPSGSSSAGNQDRGYVGYRPILPKNGLDRNNDVIRMNVFPRLEHWPSFILQGQANRPWPKSKGVEFIPDPWRCRRTDGKKWQCSRTALPDQKYCERHIHRGSKRPSEATRPFGGSVINVGPPTTSFMAQNSSGSKRPSEAPRPFGGSVINIGPPTTSLMAQNSSPADLNTSFSISTPAASQRVEKLDVTTSCSESDTIISDTTIDA